MKQILTLLTFIFLTSCISFGQTKEYTLSNGNKLLVPDFDNVLLIDGSEPVEIQIGKGTAYKVLIVEFSDTLTRKSIVLTPTVPAPVFKEFVNDHDARITYTSWSKYSGLSWTQKFFNNDVNATYTLGASINYTFTGRKIEVIMEKCDNHPTAKVELTKGTQVLDTQVIDLYLGTGGTATNACPAGVVQAVYTSQDLEPGTYGIKVTLDSQDLTKVPQRNSGVFDGFKVYE